MNFGDLNLSDIYYSANKFRNYKNVIIHYNGNFKNMFEHTLADVLTNCIIKFYEEKIIEKLINFNYFYFESFEKSKIKKICINLLNSENINESYFRKDTLWLCVYNYIKEHKAMILQGFVNFRISGYTKQLDYLTDISVNDFIIEKEYNEFIDLLRLYINSKSASNKQIHLIYREKKALLLDQNKNTISDSDEIFNTKFLSDISFSDNDYILNTLLNILPQKINIHLLTVSDDFIKTLQLIFEDKINICTDCNICKTYKFIEQ